MTYRLFIDDQRDPPDDGHKWVIARNYEYAIHILQAFGSPLFCSFDNDIDSEPKQGKDVAKWMIEKDLDTPGWLPADFHFYVHSQNVSAAMFIHGLLSNYLKSRGENS